MRLAISRYNPHKVIIIGVANNKLVGVAKSGFIRNHIESKGGLKHVL